MWRSGRNVEKRGVTFPPEAIAAERRGYRPSEFILTIGEASVIILRCAAYLRQRRAGVQ